MIVHAHIIRSIQSLVPFLIIVNIPFTNLNISDLPSPTLCVHKSEYNRMSFCVLMNVFMYVCHVLYVLVYKYSYVYLFIYVCVHVNEYAYIDEYV